MCIARKTRLASLITLSAIAANGVAFDTGPHYDMTCDTMAAEGFGSIAIQVAQVANWFNDLYENDTSNAYSGHAAWTDSKGNFIGNLLTVFRKENWPDLIVKAAEKMHFDSSNPIDTQAQAEAEWTRLCRATKASLLRCVTNQDPMGAIVVLGMTLHQVQDFYTHTNWVEPQGVRASVGHSGPGWATMGNYGSNPTWFDVPASVRANFPIYSRVEGSPEVIHGNWDSATRGEPKIAMAKDSINRPLHREAYISACIASRQWIRAARMWLNNEPFWRQMTSYSDARGRELAHDQHGTYMLSTLVGHWNGNTGAKSDDVQCAKEGVSYFEGPKPFIGRGKTVFRSKWENLVLGVTNPNPPVSDTPVPSSSMFAGLIEFVDIKINYLKQIDDIDGGDVPYVTENDADWYAKVNIAGQPYRTAMINGHNTFTFPAPYVPLNVIKMIPKQRAFAIPLSTIRVQLRTGNVDGAGSDMDLHLRINDQMRFEFPYGTFDDFERNRNDSYGFVMPKGLTLDDIGYIQLEKAGGGSNHEWLLGGMTVYANGIPIYTNNSIETWLRNRNQIWRAPALNPFSRRTTDVPVRLELWDDDWGLTGSDDQADIFPLKGRKELQFLYNPTNRQLSIDVNANGGARIRGGGDSDRAEIGFFMSTYGVIPPKGKFGDIRGESLGTVGGIKPPASTGGGRVIPPIRPPGRPPVKPKPPPRIPPP